MTSDVWPSDPRAAAALVALVVDDINNLDEVDCEALLSDFLRASWPTPRSQRQ